MENVGHVVDVYEWDGVDLVFGKVTILGFGLEAVDLVTVFLWVVEDFVVVDCLSGASVVDLFGDISVVYGIELIWDGS